MKLNVLAFGLTCALIWGIGLFVLTWWIIAFDGPSPDAVTMIGRIYRGYTISGMGSVIGLAWALADGMIGGVVFAWLYNFISSRLGSGR